MKLTGAEQDDLELARKTPYFRRETVQAKVLSLFPNRALEVLELLNEDVPSYWGPERTQLAILKLSGSDIEQLRYYINTAKRNFNDVIRLAEYPESSRIGFLNLDKLPIEQQARIFENDIRQYLDWLK